MDFHNDYPAFHEDAVNALFPEIARTREEAARCARQSEQDLKDMSLKDILEQDRYEDLKALLSDTTYSFPRHYLLRNAHSRIPPNEPLLRTMVEKVLGIPCPGDQVIELSLSPSDSSFMELHRLLCRQAIFNGVHLPSPDTVGTASSAALRLADKYLDLFPKDPSAKVLRNRCVFLISNHHMSLPAFSKRKPRTPPSQELTRIIQDLERNLINHMYIISILRRARTIISGDSQKVNQVSTVVELVEKNVYLRLRCHRDIKVECHALFTAARNRYMFYHEITIMYDKYVVPPFPFRYLDTPHSQLLRNLPLIHTREEIDLFFGGLIAHEIFHPDVCNAVIEFVLSNTSASTSMVRRYLTSMKCHNFQRIVEVDIANALVALERCIYSIYRNRQDRTSSAIQTRDPCYMTIYKTPLTDIMNMLSGHSCPLTAAAVRLAYEDDPVMCAFHEEIVILSCRSNKPL